MNDDTKKTADPDLSKLKALAEAAKGAEWSVKKHVHGAFDILDHGNVLCSRYEWHERADDMHANGDFMAAANPAAILRIAALVAQQAARIAELESVGWQPIDTAPLDGSEVLLVVELRAGSRGKQLVGHYMPGGHCIEDHPPIASGWYFWNKYSFDKASNPTHWMPLPAILTTTQEDK